MKTIIPLAMLLALGTIVPAAPPSRAPSAVTANAITVNLDGPGNPLEALSFAFGAQNPQPEAAGPGGPKEGNTVYKQVLITRVVDEATPDIVKSLMEAKPLRRVDIRQGKLNIRLDNAVIADYNLQGTAGREGGQIESFSISFEEATIRVDP